MPNLNIGSIYLGDHDHDWFIVMSRLGDQVSIRGNLSSITGFYVRRRKNEYLEMLNYVSAKYRLSPQETFQRLLKNIPLDVVLESPLEDMPIPGISDQIPDAVNVEIPIDTFEVIQKIASQENITVSEFLAKRFSL